MNLGLFNRLGKKADFRLWITGLALALLACVCAGRPDSAPGRPAAWPGSEPALNQASGLQLEIAPAEALYGTPFSIKVTGLENGEHVTIKARSTDMKKIEWESSAVFEADASGTVDLAVRAPLSGSYSGADVFGLLWSLRPLNPPEGRRIGYSEDETSGCAVELTATDSKGRAASARLERLFQMPDRRLVRVALEKNGLRGALYHPEQGGPFPGVLILAGSGGGIYEWLAQAMASNGFAALTLAYFRYRDLPPELVEIPVEYFERAVEWMKTQPSVRPDRIAVAGGSKGGELALLLASRFIDFQAVAAWTPGEHVWEGLSRK